MPPIVSSPPARAPLWLAGLLWAGAALAELPAPSAAAVDFIKDVQPIFRERCEKCHGAEKQKSGYRLDVKRVALTGGDHTAPNIVPGQSAKSPLIRFTTGLE